MMIRFILSIIFAVFATLSAGIALDSENGMWEKVLFVIGAIACVIGALLIMTV